MGARNDLPPVQSAIVAGLNGDLALRQDVPLPELKPGHVLVKVEAVALNPVDTKMVGRLATFGATSGFDFAGTVLGCEDAPGPVGQYPVKTWILGTRVCGAVNGQNALDIRGGSFAQYAAVPFHALLRVPDSMSMEDAATLGVGIGTTGLALFRSLKLDNTASPQKVLVYGGSTATGTLAIQFLKMHGHHVITTCSPSNFDLVRSRGADVVLDYHSPTAISDIRAHTENSLQYVFDCVTAAETVAFCQACMGRLGGYYTTTEPFPDSLLTKKRIKHSWVLQPEVLGKPIGWPAPFNRPEANPEMAQWAAQWYDTVQAALDRGALTPHPAQLQPGGLGGILGDMELLQKQKVSGVKLVYRVESS